MIRCSISLKDNGLTCVCTIHNSPVFSRIYICCMCVCVCVC